MGTPEDVAAEKYFTPPEDIREGIAKIIKDIIIEENEDGTAQMCPTCEDDAIDQILQYLKDNGVVRLAENQMPEIFSIHTHLYSKEHLDGFIHQGKRIEQANFKRVEELR